MPTKPYFGIAHNRPKDSEHAASFGEALTKGQVRRWGAVKPSYNHVLQAVQGMKYKDVNDVMKKVAAFLTSAELARLKRLLSLPRGRARITATRTERNLPRYVASRFNEEGVIPETDSEDEIYNEPDLLPPRPQRRLRKKRTVKKKKSLFGSI